MERLPNEMVHMITRYLNDKDFISVILVCKKFRDNTYLCKELNDRLNCLDWNEISQNCKWNETCIDKYYDYFYSYSLFSNKTFSEEFLRKNSHRLNWDIISYSQILSETFIRDFQDDLNWKLISRWQRLSESFLEEFKDKIYFHRISLYQKLSKEFIEKYKNKIIWQGLIKF
jgi:hypothetical protein